MIQRFELHRDEDETGVSGLGHVASGVRVGPWAFMRWHTPCWTVTWYPKWEWVDVLHGHGGKTRIVWRNG